MSFTSYPRDRTIWVALAALCLALDASAVPFLPTDDAQVLEQLPARNTPQYRQLKSLQAAAAQAPSDPGLATRLATAYIRASRVEGDPRFLGYAQAALSPWWKDRQAPTPVLVLRATNQPSNQAAREDRVFPEVLEVASVARFAGEVDAPAKRHIEALGTKFAADESAVFVGAVQVHVAAAARLHGRAVE